MARYELEQFTRSQISTTATGTKDVEGTVPYIAPELLECGAKHNYKSDVYSLSMFMVEFTLPKRSHPWEGETATSDLILYHVKQNKRININLSDLPQTDIAYETWFDLIRLCWDQNPDQRPTAVDIYTKLSSILENSCWFN